MSFQSVIFALQNYWAAQDCVILQPYDVEVGAGEPLAAIADVAEWIEARVLWGRYGL